MKVTVAATQMACSWDIDENVSKAESMINEAADAGAQVILIQELFETPYFCIDNQHKHFWRPMIADLTQREDEVAGKKALIYGAGTIGSRVGRVLQALDVEVIGFRRNPDGVESGFDQVLTPARFDSELPSADFVFLTCPLNDETRGLMNATRLAAMRSDAFLINVARGGSAILRQTYHPGCT